MSSDLYILDPRGHKYPPIPVEDGAVWAEWRSKAKVRVASHQVGDVRVSTVFLGVDHGYGEGLPVLWETMVFGGPHDSFQKRYSSYREARDGHTAALIMTGLLTARQAAMFVLSGAHP